MEKSDNIHSYINNLKGFEFKSSGVNTRKFSIGLLFTTPKKLLNRQLRLVKINLGLIKKTSIIMLATLGVGFTVGVDIADRSVFNTGDIPKEEAEEFSIYKSFDEIKEDYKRNFGNPAYSFPRGDFDKVIVYKNNFLTSRITARTLSENDAVFITTFFNESKNFNWQETDWNIREAEYIVRFFDKNEQEVGKVWLCVNGCSSIKSMPFSPNMKFGKISEDGRKKLQELITRVFEN